jgi:hypothetical protein
VNGFAITMLADRIARWDLGFLSTFGGSEQTYCRRSQIVEIYRPMNSFGFIDRLQSLAVHIHLQVFRRGLGNKCVAQRVCPMEAQSKRR